MKRREDIKLGVSSESMPFLQTWLFYGLLGTVFKRDPSEIWRDFSREPTELTQAAVTTERLICYTKKYLPGLTRFDRIEIYGCLRTAYNVLNFICNKPIESSLYSKVLLSLSTLGEYLTLLVWRFFREDDPMELPSLLFTAWPAGVLGNGHFLSQRMQDDGWCCRDIARHVQVLLTSGLYYTSQFGNPDAHTSHLSCTFTECKSAKIPENSYKTKHVCEYGDCGDVTANPIQLNSILQDGSVPLIPITDDNTEFPRDQYLDLVKFGANKTYVAISHVWSEGLGNESQNSLPRCQLLRLSLFVKELYDMKTAGQICFWIDSICCPRKPDESRRLAIAKMRDIYADADKVLVLDSWLQTQGMDGQSPFELGLKVFASKWNKRLWTLQEGAIAKELFFRFEAHSFLYQDDELRGDYSARLDLDKNDLKQFMIKTTCEEAYDTLRGHRLSITSERHDRRRTYSIIRGLKHRDTSHEQDEGLCLGTLFGLELKKIFDAQTTEKRMATVWTLLPDIPPSLIFSFAPRIGQDGFRWAPRTLRWSTSAVFDDHPGYVPAPARFHSAAEAKGLLVEYPGVLFVCLRRPLSPTFFFKLELWYRVSCNANFENRRVRFGMDAPEPIAEDRKIAVDWCKIGQSSKRASVGLILNVGLPRIDPLLGGRGILVSIQRERNNIIFANFESTVSVRGIEQQSSLERGLESCGIKLNNDTITVVEEAKVREQSQKWCLS